MTPKEKLTFALQHISSSYVDSSYTKTDKSKQLKKACIKAIWMIVEKNYSRTYVCKSLPKKYNLGTGLSLRCNRIFIVLFFNSLFFGNIYYTLMFTNYLLLTEMFLPRDIVAYHLKNVS